MIKKLLVIVFAVLMCLTSCGQSSSELLSSAVYNVTLNMEENVLTGTAEYEIVKTENKGALLNYRLKNTDIGDAAATRLDLGYFYILDNKVWKIEEKDIDDLKNGVVSERAVLIWQAEELNDTLKEDEKGFHQSIECNGDFCEYSSYNNQVESGYYENIVWSKSRGLVSFRSGYGAGRNAIEFNLIDNAE